MKLMKWLGGMVDRRHSNDGTCISERAICLIVVLVLILMLVVQLMQVDADDMKWWCGLWDGSSSVIQTTVLASLNEQSVRFGAGAGADTDVGSATDASGIADDTKWWCGLRDGSSSSFKRRYLHLWTSNLFDRGAGAVMMLVVQMMQVGLRMTWSDDVACGMVYRRRHSNDGTCISERAICLIVVLVLILILVVCRCHYNEHTWKGGCIRRNQGSIQCALALLKKPCFYNVEVRRYVCMNAFGCCTDCDENCELFLACTCTACMKI